MMSLDNIRTALSTIEDQTAGLETELRREMDRADVATKLLRDLCGAIAFTEDRDRLLELARKTIEALEDGRDELA
jgi:hypothetical protein